MTTQSMSIAEYGPHYKLLGKIVEIAVNDFNTGNAAERMDAAIFFRSDEDFGWMLDAVNGNMDRFIANRLCESPFKAGTFKSRKHKMKACKPGKKIKWAGREMTVAEWAGELGIELHAFRRRLTVKGVCAEVFEV